MEQFTKQQLDTIFFALESYQYETEQKLDIESLALDTSYRTKIITKEQEDYLKHFRKEKEFYIALLEERNKEIALLRHIVREERCKITTEMKGDK